MPCVGKLSGKFNDDLFKKSYNFLPQQRQDEIGRLKQQLKTAKEAGTKRKGTKRGGAKHKSRPAPVSEEQQYEWQQELGRLQQEHAEDHKLEAKKVAKRTRRKQEEAAVAAGKKPYYLKRSELKKLEMKERFQQLQNDGKLKKVLQKKRKKNRSKEATKMPRERRGD